MSERHLKNLLNVIYERCSFSHKITARVDVGVQAAAYAQVQLCVFLLKYCSICINHIIPELNQMRIITAAHHQVMWLPGRASHHLFM